MANKVLALNIDGELSYCSAPPEMRGKGRCNHLAHKEDGETQEEFTQRAAIQLANYSDAVPIPDVKPLFDFGDKEHEHDVTVKVKPFRLSEEAKLNGTKVTRKADFQQNFEEGHTLYMETPEGAELWNEMDMNAFAQIHGKIRKSELIEVLLGNKEIITSSSVEKLPVGMVYDEYAQNKVDRLNKKTLEDEEYTFKKANPDATENEIKKHLDEVELIELGHGTGVLELNKVAKEYGFTATKDIPVLPYYMRPSTDTMDDPLTTAYLYMHHMRNKPDAMQRAYLNLLNNNALPVDERKYSDGFASKSLADQFAGKNGVFRKYISGRAVPYTGRAVIEPSLDVRYGEIILPAASAIDIYKPTVTKFMLEDGKTDEEIEEFIKRFRPGRINKKDAQKLEEYMNRGDVRVLAVRQPSSHSANLQSFKPRVTTQPTIFVHPLTDEGYGGDHDGDTQGLFGINSARMAPIVDRALSSRNDINTRKERKLSESQILPSKDALFGLMSVLKARSK